MVTLLGCGSSFGFTICIPGGIMPLGGSFTSTSSPASREVEKSLINEKGNFAAHAEAEMI